MSVVADMVEKMVAAGATPEVIAIAVTAFETLRDGGVTVARRREKSAARSRAYRERRRRDAGVTQRDASRSPPPSSSSPTPPLLTTPESSLRSDSSRARWPADFREQFWAAYPRPVAKKAAIKALEKLQRSGEVEFSKLMDAVRVYAARADPNFTCHPATWLNAGRWDDKELPLNGTHNGNRSHNRQTISERADDLIARAKAAERAAGLGEPEPFTIEGTRGS